MPSPAAGAARDTVAAVVHPEVRRSLDGPLLVAGTSLLAIGLTMDATIQPVPPEGLDPAGIHWSFDRTNLGKSDTRAESRSDYALGLTLAYPMVAAYFSQPPGERGRGTLRRPILYAEALLITQGLTSLLKKSIDRPRPFTYLPADERPDLHAYDVTTAEAFQSMPSGHSSMAFCGAAFAMTDNLLSRPQAGWLERAGVPFVGGVLAGMTAAMRVEGGMHFPSDVIAGGAIGASSGAAVPLLHHYLCADGRRAPRPSGRAWGQAIAGLLAGVGTGLLAADAIW